MSNKILIVVDMQKDFVNGSLGSKEAQEIILNVIEKIHDFKGKVIFTLDTHDDNYFDTLEGINLPVSHCVKNTEGWHLIEELDYLQQEGNCEVYEKPTFGCTKLALDLKDLNEKEPIESIELIGVCTDICVVSNALLIKSFLPEVKMIVDENCCAGTSVENHKAALQVMKCCHINII